MTIGDIQSAIAKYLQRDVSAFDVGTSGKNLILTALNHARKYAERRHNFSVCRQRGYLLVSAGGKAAWDSPTWFDGGSEKMKEGVSWWTRPDVTDTSTEYSADDVPIKVISSGVKEQLERRRQYEDWQNEWNKAERQLWQTGVNHPLLGQPYALTRGKWLELHPSATAQTMLVVDGYRWWGDWGADALAGGEAAMVSVPLARFNDVNSVGESLRIAEIDTSPSGTGYTADIYGAAIPGGVTVPWTGVIAYMRWAETVPSDYVTVLSRLGWTSRVSDDGTAVEITSRQLGADVTLTVTQTLVSPSAGTWSISDTGAGGNGSGEDWWTENASEFLMWRGIVEANRLNQMFVGNKEGNLSPPEKEAERALQELIAQDIASEMNGAQLEFLA